MKSGVYITPKRIRVRPKTPSKLVYSFGVRLQYYGMILDKYIKSEFNPAQPQGARDLIPAISLMDKLANTSMKLTRTAKSISSERNEEPDLAIELSKEKKEDADKGISE